MLLFLWLMVGYMGQVTPIGNEVKLKMKNLSDVVTGLWRTTLLVTSLRCLVKYIPEDNIYYLNTHFPMLLLYTWHWLWSDLGRLHCVSRYIVSRYYFQCNWHLSRYICKFFKRNCNISRYIAKIYILDKWLF